jgi:hypothetical protein
MKSNFLTTKRVVAGIIVLVVVLAAAGGIYALQKWDKITNKQTDLFNQTPPPAQTTENTATPAPETATPQPTEGQTATETAAPSATPTVDPEAYLDSQADKSIMKDTVNVLLIGVDSAPERIGNTKQYVDKNFNSDVMLLLAINFKKNTVNMISFPRDSYAPMANMDGIYKMNFALRGPVRRWRSSGVARRPTTRWGRVRTRRAAPGSGRARNLVARAAQCARQHRAVEGAADGSAARRRARQLVDRRAVVAGRARSG